MNSDKKINNTSKLLDSCFMLLNARSYTPRGFTLLELILVFALLGILTSAGLVAYSVFNSSQGIQSGTADVTNLLTTAKSRAISQASPPACSGKSLQGYQVTISIATSQYALHAVCGGSTFLLDSRQLPPNVTFVAGSMSNVMFVVSSGSPSAPGTISLSGNGKTKTISVESTGNIMTN